MNAALYNAIVAVKEVAVLVSAPSDDVDEYKKLAAALGDALGSQSPLWDASGQRYLPLDYCHARGGVYQRVTAGAVTNDATLLASAVPPSHAVPLLSEALTATTAFGAVKLVPSMDPGGASGPLRAAPRAARAQPFPALCRPFFSRQQAPERGLLCPPHLPAL